MRYTNKLQVQDYTKYLYANYCGNEQLKARIFLRNMAPAHPCMECTKGVWSNILAINCDVCSRWCHIQWEVSENEHFLLLLEPIDRDMDFRALIAMERSAKNFSQTCRLACSPSAVPDNKIRSSAKARIATLESPRAIPLLLPILRINSSRTRLNNIEDRGQPYGQLIRRL